MIVYDARGTGLSDHDADDLTLDGFVRDIDAVAKASGHERFSLYGSLDSSRVMIRYAAQRPERVARLVLWLPSVSPERLRGDPGLRAVTSLASRDWELYISTLSHAVIGGWDAERAPFAAGYAEVMRHSLRQHEFPRFLDAMREHDVSADLARVQAPTLVLAREDASSYTVPVVREVAAGIPGARLVVVPGNWLLPCTDEEMPGEVKTSREIISFMTEQKARTAEQPIAPAHNGHNGHTPNDGASQLSPREREVLALLSQGKTNAQIAAHLVVAPATASRHVHNILQKLGMNRRAEAAAYAARAGLAEALPR
jgi:DNA-binding NarL/FixJ family response regulator